MAALMVMDFLSAPYVAIRDWLNPGATTSKLPAITLAMLWNKGTEVSISWSKTKTREAVVGTSVAPSAGFTEASLGADWAKPSKHRRRIVDPKIRAALGNRIQGFGNFIGVGADRVRGWIGVVANPRAANRSRPDSKRKSVC